MKTLIAIIIKFVGVCVAAWIAFMVFGTVAFWTVFLIACAVTVLNYLIGDLWVLPNWGNIWASIIDGILAGGTAWVILYYTPVTNNYYNWLWVFAVIIAVAEFFFHMYLFNAHVVEKKRSDSALYKKDKLNYNTEHGGELFPYSRRFNSGGSSDLQSNRLNNENTFGDSGYDASDSDTGGDWYNDVKPSNSADNSTRYGVSGSQSQNRGSDKGGGGSGGRNGKNKTK
ncbi:MAG TPA: DUF2512 family protein [Anaerovoracaceae bacterium]|nr:DUF2512 family protein [Anaerovoracaceae bacterium]